MKKYIHVDINCNLKSWNKCIEGKRSIYKVINKLTAIAIIQIFVIYGGRLDLLISGSS